MVKEVASQDLRRRRRRHHHRHRPGRGHLQRGPPGRRRRRQPDAHEARHGEGRRGHRRQAQEDEHPGQGQEGPGERRHRRRQHRHRDRQDHRRGDGQGRQGRRHHRRGGQDPRDRATSSSRACSSTAATCRRTSSPTRRRWSASSRTPTSSSTRRRSRQQRDLVPVLEKVAQPGQAAPDHRRGRRGRGPGDPGHQQAPRGTFKVLRRQGPRLRRPPQGHARGHRHPDRRQGRSSRTWASSSRTSRSSDLGRAKKVKIDKDNTTIIEGAGKKDDIKARIASDPAASSTRPPATTTRRS